MLHLGQFFFPVLDKFHVQCKLTNYLPRVCTMQNFSLTKTIKLLTTPEEKKTNVFTPLRSYIKRPRFTTITKNLNSCKCHS